MFDDLMYVKKVFVGRKTTKNSSKQGGQGIGLYIGNIKVGSFPFKDLPGPDKFGNEFKSLILFSMLRVSCITGISTIFIPACRSWSLSGPSPGGRHTTGLKLADLCKHSTRCISTLDEPYRSFEELINAICRLFFITKCFEIVLIEAVDPFFLILT